MCIGFWVGVFLFGINKWTELFSFEVSMANFLILGGLSSGTSYVLSMLFDDDGLKIKDKSILIDEEITNAETDFFVNEDEVIH